MKIFLIQILLTFFITFIAVFVYTQFIMLSTKPVGMWTSIVIGILGGGLTAIAFLIVSVIRLTLN